MILKRIIYVLVCVSLIGCSINNSKANNRKIYKINDIPDNAVERINNAYIYEIKFSNFIYNTVKTEKKRIKIPIFQGYLEDVVYDDFLSYCEEKKILDPGVAESGFFISTKRGEVKKTLLEFIKFYEGNILKGYEKPIDMIKEGDGPQYLTWIIDYKFKVENIPCILMILVKADKRDSGRPYEYFKSIEDIHPDENDEIPGFDSGFVYEFYIDQEEF